MATGLIMPGATHGGAGDQAVALCSAIDTAGILAQPGADAACQPVDT